MHSVKAAFPTLVPDERQVVNWLLAMACEEPNMPNTINFYGTRDGYFEWEEFRQEMISEIAGWERTHALDDPGWDYYEQWLAVLEKLIEIHISNAETT